ncbi:MAG TPA: hypothetical protein VM124_03760 [Candidatus Limnocylindrales bacterium]|nr:hypothetical protein [Candidatus Limnocylindrales bacterium]
MNMPKEVRPVALEKDDGNQAPLLLDANAEQATLRASELLAWSRPRVWLGAVVELGDGSIDYGLGDFTRDH